MKKVLYCFLTRKDYVAENLRSEILEALKIWKKENKISVVVSDNATNILAAVKIVG